MARIYSSDRHASGRLQRAQPANSDSPAKSYTFAYIYRQPY